MGNASIRDTDLIGDALDSIASLLPASWSIEERDQGRSVAADAAIDLTAPTGERVSFVLVGHRSGSMAIDRLLSALRALRQKASLPVLFVSDYIGPTLRTALAAEGFSYADPTGWVRVTSQNPLVLLTGQGAKRSPRPEGTSAVVRLNGVAASRIIRQLAIVKPPVGVRDLATLAGASPGSVSKLLTTLAAEGIVDRDDRGAVAAVRRRALIRRWVRDYAFAETNTSVSYFIAPRGLDRALDHLKSSQTPVSLTGSAAARKWLPEGTISVVPLRLLALYASRPRAVAGDLGLIDADPATAHVVIAVPQDHKVLSVTNGEVPAAPVALVLADLLTLPNRSDAEADQLMNALARADATWKE